MKSKHRAHVILLAALVGIVTALSVFPAEAQVFLGKYRGTVVNVEDPEGRGRIQASVPEVLGSGLSAWALPALPFAGVGHGLVLLPELGDNVWVEFEGGDPGRPIWTGAWFSAPVAGGHSLATTRALVTSQGHRILVDEAAGRVEVAHGGGNAITLTDEEISLSVRGTSLVLRADGIYVNGKLVTKSK